MATEHLRADPELVAGLGEPLLGGRTFDLDLAQPGADLLARQRVILSVRVFAPSLAVRRENEPPSPGAALDPRAEWLQFPGELPRCL